ncbi:zonadhesin [Cololabis saira]|uniref:zonadhesin n=1 Tax=Cololabis saira TaxID=129043 RepID=UPI002AD1F815|nr:zonadhesin [Cololabis saira]
MLGSINMHLLVIAGVLLTWTVTECRHWNDLSVVSLPERTSSDYVTQCFYNKHANLTCDWTRSQKTVPEDVTVNMLESRPLEIEGMACLEFWYLAPAASVGSELRALLKSSSGQVKIWTSPTFPRDAWRQVFLPLDINETGSWLAFEAIYPVSVEDQTHLKQIGVRRGSCGNQCDSNTELLTDESTRCICSFGQLFCFQPQCQEDQICGPQRGGLSGLSNSGMCTIHHNTDLSTFDGMMFHFMAPCSYVLSKSCSTTGVIPKFSVEVVNEQNSNGSLPNVQQIIVNLGNIWVSLLKSQMQQAMVNGVWKNLPFSHSNGLLNIKSNPAAAVVETNLGLTVSYDNAGDVIIYLPSNFSGEVCGLCGNFNHLRGDDFHKPDGTYAENAKALGESWQTGEIGSSCETILVPFQCDQLKEAEYASEVYCGGILSGTGAFADCLSVIGAQSYFRTCVAGMCSSHGDQTVLCEMFQDYAAICQEAGVAVPTWRNSTFCRQGGAALPANPNLNTPASQSVRVPTTSTPTAKHPVMTATMPPVKGSGHLLNGRNATVVPGLPLHPVCQVNCDFEQDLCQWSQMLTDVLDWKRHNGSTATITGPASDHTTGGGQYLYIEFTAVSLGATARLISLECSDSGPQCFQFWYHTYGSADTMGLHIYLIQDRKVDAVWRKKNNQRNMWHQAQVDLMTTGAFQLMIEARGSNDQSDAAIDDISLQRGFCTDVANPASPVPTTMSQLPIQSYEFPLLKSTITTSRPPLTEASPTPQSEATEPQPQTNTLPPTTTTWLPMSTEASPTPGQELFPTPQPEVTETQPQTTTQTLVTTTRPLPTEVNSPLQPEVTKQQPLNTTPPRTTKSTSVTTSEVLSTEASPTTEPEVTEPQPETITLLPATTRRPMATEASLTPGPQLFPTPQPEVTEPQPQTTTRMPVATTMPLTTEGSPTPQPEVTKRQPLNTTPPSTTESTSVTTGEVLSTEASPTTEPEVTEPQPLTSRPTATTTKLPLTTETKPPQHPEVTATRPTTTRLTLTTEVSMTTEAIQTPGPQLFPTTRPEVPEMQPETTTKPPAFTTSLPLATEASPATKPQLQTTIRLPATTYRLPLPTEVSPTPQSEATELQPQTTTSQPPTTTRLPLAKETKPPQHPEVTATQPPATRQTLTTEVSMTTEAIQTPGPQLFPTTRPEVPEMQPETTTKPPVTTTSLPLATEAGPATEPQLQTTLGLPATTYRLPLPTKVSPTPQSEATELQPQVTTSQPPTTTRLPLATEVSPTHGPQRFPTPEQEVPELQPHTNTQPTVTTTRPPLTTEGSTVPQPEVTAPEQHATSTRQPNTEVSPTPQPEVTEPQPQTTTRMPVTTTRLPLTTDVSPPLQPEVTKRQPLNTTPPSTTESTSVTTGEVLSTEASPTTEPEVTEPQPETTTLLPGTTRLPMATEASVTPGPQLFPTPQPEVTEPQPRTTTRTTVNTTALTLTTEVSPTPQPEVTELQPLTSRPTATTTKPPLTTETKPPQHPEVTATQPPATRLTLTTEVSMTTEAIQTPGPQLFPTTEPEVPETQPDTTTSLPATTTSLPLATEASPTPQPKATEPWPQTTTQPSITTRLPMNMEASPTPGPQLSPTPQSEVTEPQTETTTWTPATTTRLALTTEVSMTTEAIKNAITTRLPLTTEATTIPKMTVTAPKPPATTIRQPINTDSPESQHQTTTLPTATTMATKVSPTSQPEATESQRQTTTRPTATTSPPLTTEPSRTTQPETMDLLPNTTTGPPTTTVRSLTTEMSPPLTPEVTPQPLATTTRPLLTTDGLPSLITFFPTPSCAKNSHYTACVPPCGPTCDFLNGPPHCSNNGCVPGCVCDDGFLQKGGTCLPAQECGCVDKNGIKRKFNEVWYTSHCSQKCKCDEDDGMGKIDCDDEGCEDAVCLQNEMGYYCQSTGFGGCTVKGDPEYKTFDGMKHNFEGERSYVLLRTKNLPSNLPDVYIEIINACTEDNQHDDSSEEDSSSIEDDHEKDAVQELKIRVYNHTVEFKKHRKLFVDGIKIQTTVTPTPGFDIQKRSSRIYLKADFGLSVESDGLCKAEIILPNFYKRKVEGLCGNFDGQKWNERMKPDGTRAKSIQEFGESWAV